MYRNKLLSEEEVAEINSDPQLQLLETDDYGRYPAPFAKLLSYTIGEDLLGLPCRLIDFKAAVEKLFREQLSFCSCCQVIKLRGGRYCSKCGSPMSQEVGAVTLTIPAPSLPPQSQTQPVNPLELGQLLVRPLR